MNTRVARRICITAICGTAFSGCASLSTVNMQGAETARPPIEHRATTLQSFEGIEDPAVKYVVAQGRCLPDDFPNITDQGDGLFRMLLRYRPGNPPDAGWWDGDQSTDRNDRQRAEVKGLGPHQHNGETFEYAMTWRTNADFTDPQNETNVTYDNPIEKRRRHFCHTFQLKAVDGSAGPPMITLSVEEGNSTATVDDWTGEAAQPTVVRTFSWHPGEWHRVAIRVKTSLHHDGFVLVSVDGDDFRGIQNVDVYRPLSTNYRPKWGLYRAAGPAAQMHDDWVEFKDISVRRLRP